jgi:hypothetical protein
MKTRLFNRNQVVEYHFGLSTILSILLGKHYKTRYFSFRKRQQFFGGKMKNMTNIQRWYGQYDPERLEGMVAIRKFMDPYMSKSYFYKYHRKEIDYLLLEHQRWWLRPDKIRFFTWKRLLIAHMLEKKYI